MASQDNFSNLQISFVVPEKCASEEECSEEMWEAYNMCLQNEFSLDWIEEKNCLSLNPQKTDVFVMEEFEGLAFEKLRRSKCLIIGPRCLLNCFLSGEPIPDGNNPVFTTAMRGMIICVTGLNQEIKANIEKKVQYMGGIFMKQLRASITHLISDSVMSQKYEKAVERGIPVFTERWITAIWEANLKNFVKADDPRFDKYKCPVFMNLVVTSTNLPKQQKKMAQTLVNENGGTFMGVLDGSKVKVVLAPDNCALTDKFKYAKQNNIACLNIDWVSESLNAGYALRFKDYLVSSTISDVENRGCSTPEKSQVSMINCSTISAIGEPRCSGNIVDETMGTTVNSTVTSDVTRSDGQSVTPCVTRLDRLDIREVKLAGPFLDGCNIYLAGFPKTRRDKINRILNAGGATRLNDISDALTHVIVDDHNQASSELKLMQAKGLNPYILGLDWLEESLRLRRPAPEEHYIDEKKKNSTSKTTEPPSPLSKKNLQMLQRPKRPPVPQFDIDRKSTTKEADESEEETSLVQQYLQKSKNKNNISEVSFQEILHPENATANETTKITNNDQTANTPKVSKSNVTSSRDDANDSAVPSSQPTKGEKMFEGLNFLVNGFDEEEGSIVVQNIAALGGNIVSNSFVGIPDYGVVPFHGALLKHTVDEVVTDFFIEDCIDQEQLVDLAYYHRPLSIPKEAKPLAGLVIVMSTYTGVERSYLTKVASTLGANCQHTFARKTNPERNHVGSTHLICPKPDGSMYKAAVKWKLPAVTAAWLRACVTEVKRVDETSYLVGETMAPSRPPVSANTSGMDPPAAPSPRTVLTPKRLLPQGQVTPGYETPPVNQRLSLAMGSTPQSPYHIATPETPYGQVFQDNPSPQTRKDWLRWIEGFPDMRVDEPPPRKRALSTPLSEIIRQFWEKSKEPLRSQKSCKAESPTTEGNDLTTSSTEEALIKRKLSFTEDSVSSKKAIDFQIEQLDQVLQATSSTPESRYSLSGNAKVYNEQPIDRINKCMVKDSQPDTVGWEDPAHHILPPFASSESAVINVKRERENASTKTSRKFKFMLSGIKDRENYGNVIKKLGGELSTETDFDPTATHLLCIRPARNEKMLGCIASGKWVLHCTYLRDCDEEGTFIDEEKYEWGNPQSKNVIPEPNGSLEISIAAAAHRWRLKLEKEPGGPFQGMVAMLLVHPNKHDQYARLIKAGGGTVVRAKAPYVSNPKITHCFVQRINREQVVEWAMLATQGIMCLAPPYLSDYLTAETPPNPRDAAIDEFKKYFSLMPK